MDNNLSEQETELPQPLGIFHSIIEGDALHYGYWPDGEPELTLSQAQEEHSRLLLKQFPKPPARVLDVGCGLGLMAGELNNRGYSVTAIAPSEALISYAQKHHYGPQYICCGFMDDNPAMADGQFDIVLFQESLQYFPDLDAVFNKAANLLAVDGNIIFCDEVSYDEKTKSRSAVHTFTAIEQSFFKCGFYIQHHESMSREVTATCSDVLDRLHNKKMQLADSDEHQIKKQVEELIIEWQNLDLWYKNGVFGYELWKLGHSQYAIRSYQNGDERIIIDEFNKAFNVERTMQHWLWKYKNNPQGGPYISTAWDNDKLASHYSAYPLSITKGTEESLVYHVGDTFTVAKYRGIGRGNTNLLSRAVRFFHKTWCQGKIDFFYGFNTGKIQKLGKRFLSYEPITKVYEYKYSCENSTFNSRLSRLLKGYQIEFSSHCDDWADKLFNEARHDYQVLITRNKAYFQWRYDNHPDFNYQYILLKQWGKIVGCCVVYKENQTMFLIDVLCRKKHSRQLIKSLQEIIHKDSKYIEITSWFSDTPKWWSTQLIKCGFIKQPQFQELDLCATFFNSKYHKDELANKFYFTMGDSDLY